MTMLDLEPVVLEKQDEAKPCSYTLCRQTPRWSVIWTCGETCLYCDRHLGWAQRESAAGGISCSCNPNNPVESPVIFIMMVVPL